MRVTAIRLAATLLPAALLLHEGAYLASGADGSRGHGYFELLLPLVAAASATLALASILLPAVVRREPPPGQRPQGRLDRAVLAPFGLAGSLLAIFAVQEGVEALLLGGGLEGLAGAAAGAWVVIPLALALGALVCAAIESLARAGALAARLVGPERIRRRRRSASRRPAPATSLPGPSLSPLASGLARRPPPAPART